MSTRNLVEISLSGLDDEATQAIAGLFDRWGLGGAVVEQIVGGNTGPQPRFTLKTYLLAEDDDALRQIEIGLALLRQAHNASPSRGLAGTRRLPEPCKRFLAETDWAEAWKAGYDVLRIGRRLVVKPTWRDYTPQLDDLVIELDPGMAFGSGLHPTTRLCLEALEDHFHTSATLLDVGTGSGILAIAAARLGALRVLALDTDPLAVQIARENVALNQVESLVCVEVGTVQNFALQSPTWDLVVANIMAETIIELTPWLGASLSPGGTLIASGIIPDRADAVLDSLREHGLSPVERRDDGEWVALIAHKVEGETPIS